MADKIPDTIMSGPLKTLVLHQPTGMYFDLTECVMAHLPANFIAWLDEEEGALGKFMAHYSNNYNDAHNEAVTAYTPK